MLLQCYHHDWIILHWSTIAEKHQQQQRPQRPKTRNLSFGMIISIYYMCLCVFVFVYLIKAYNAKNQSVTRHKSPRDTLNEDLLHALMWVGRVLDTWIFYSRAVLIASKTPMPVQHTFARRMSWHDILYVRKCGSIAKQYRFRIFFVYLR